MSNNITYYFYQVFQGVKFLMGLKSRLRAERLPIKLKEIRGKLGLSQNEMLQQIGYEENFDRSTISHYESGEREPPLPILLAYARAANIYVDELIDDNLDLPKKLPKSGKRF